MVPPVYMTKTRFAALIKFPRIFAHGPLWPNSILAMCIAQGKRVEKPVKVHELSVLLVQIRDHGSVRDEEVESFIRHGDLEDSQLHVLNVFDTPSFLPSIVDPYDVVLVGGASEASVLDPETYRFVPHIISLLQYCVTTNKPVFASCFGFQAAVLGLGGTIVRDGVDFEMGTIPLTLTAAANEDPLFSTAPDGMLAVSCHQEMATEVPNGCVVLAKTDRCLHAFRVAGKPFWAFQFHPELDRACFVQRLGIFQEKYTDSAEDYEGVAAQFKETPESNQLLRRFFEH